MQKKRDLARKALLLARKGGRGALAEKRTEIKGEREAAYL